MQVVILCGGQGTRLKEETQFRPKALVEIGGRPILWHIMKGYAQYGFREFILCLGYKGDMIKRYFLDYDLLQYDVKIRLGATKSIAVLNAEAPENWTVACVDTGFETPTGGRIHRIRSLIPETDDTFMATYCDGVSNIDIGGLLAFHRKRGRVATVTAVRPISRFGVLQVEDDLATGFAKGAHVESGWIDGGFFVFNKRIFEYLDDASWLSGDVRDVQGGRGRATLQRLIEDQELAVYQHDGFWAPMDTPRDLETLTEMWKTGRSDWKVWP
jgi:glucose-1-phosphate cytidylyltransferase